MMHLFASVTGASPGAALNVVHVWVDCSHATLCAISTIKKGDLGVPAFGRSFADLHRLARRFLR